MNLIVVCAFAVLLSPVASIAQMSDASNNAQEVDAPFDAPFPDAPGAHTDAPSAPVPVAPQNAISLKQE